MEEKKPSLFFRKLQLIIILPVGLYLWEGLICRGIICINFTVVVVPKMFPKIVNGLKHF